MHNTPMHQASQALRIAFPRTQSLHYSTARCSQDIAEYTREFNACLLQDLMDAVHQLRAILRAPWMRSRVTSRRSCWGWSGTKLGVRRPCCSRSASHSASCTSVLRPGTRFRCESRDEDQFNIANQTISHRTPQNSGALHSDVATADFDKPTFAGEVILWSSSQRYEFLSVGGKLSMMLTHATNPALMHVQSTTPSIEDFHPSKEESLRLVETRSGKEKKR